MRRLTPGSTATLVVATCAIVAYIALLALEPGHHSLKHAAGAALIAITLVSVVLLELLKPPHP